ncbi:hypothetical protein DSL72_000836 [Monilinia vaccinii-corymbosi]|uniref:Uncharacterized protein n=1 Tax=Monilinia vaccinii-corymbosi TaxID=61207 RepID=A0A8A3P0G0_9HELO|nr:hypothetical protein DSL72_000836 [Monilinia vaccinii-corymbosi]
MAHDSPSKAKLRTTLPFALQSNGHPLSHPNSQSQLHLNVHAKLGPWAQWGQTSASLNGLETMERPKMTHSVTPGDKHHFNKDPLPVVPSILVKRSGRGSRRLDGRLNEYGDPVPRPSMDISGSMSYDDNVTRRDKKMQKVVSRAYSSPKTRTLTPPPDPPMSKSATKVMQRTGYDPTMEIREGGGSPLSSLHIITDNSDDSSGSSYSQEDDTNSSIAQRNQSIGSVPVSPMQQDEMHLHSPKYSVSNVSSPTSSTPKSLVASPEYKQRVSMFMQGYLGEPNDKRSPPHSTSFEDLIDQERVRSEYQGRGDNPLGHDVHNDDLALMPLPLAVPIRKGRQSYFSESAEDCEPQTHVAPLFANEQQQSIHQPSTVSFTPSMSSPNPITPEPKKTRKRDFAGGKHPLKSPFAFLSNHKTPESPKGTGSTVSLGNKISGALKQLSFTKTLPTDRNEVIPDARRSPTGPNTPMPKKSGFMGIKGTQDVIQKGNEHFHGVVEKAKLSVNRKDRRRKELKEQIVVVGMMDQTPGQ